MQNKKPQNLVQKILSAHLIEGNLASGEEIGIKIDQCLSQDATGTMAYLQWETLGLENPKTEIAVSYVDHNVLQMGFENADDHRYLASIAKKYGLYFSQAGNGICHQVHLERFSQPGKTLLGSDSHTPTCGGIGMIAIGAGGLDVALALAGQPFYIPRPRVIRVELTGKIQPWVSGKDIILKVLEIFGTKGNVGVILEYAGSGLASLAVADRCTIANMGAECGVTTSVFPSDELTRIYLASQCREDFWIPLQADSGAEYEKSVTIDLDTLEPMAALPSNPGNIMTVRNAAKELKGRKIEQVCIGTCTNSSYKDIATVALVLQQRKPDPSVSLVLTPGSRQVLLNISQDGFLQPLLAAGARIVEPSCSFCIGNGMSPASASVSVRTSNRNFTGRSGTIDDAVFLVSPETAVATAICGILTDPRDLGLAPPVVQLPKQFLIDNHKLLSPLPVKERENIQIIRGPNIGAPPQAYPFQDILSGIVAIKLPDKITTDHIIPAGIRMKFRSNIARYADFVFENIDKTFPSRAQTIKDSGKYSFIVAGFSYGQGSSREHAAICPAYLGVRAVLALSFERIHAANLVNFGILPLIFSCKEDYELIQQGDSMELSGLKSVLSSTNSELYITNNSRGNKILLGLELTKRQRNILLQGGALCTNNMGYKAGQ